MKLRLLPFEKFVCLLLTLLPLVDTINGYLVKNNVSSIGIIYKFFICATLFLECIRQKRFKIKYVKTIVYVISYIMMTYITNSILNTYKTVRSDLLIKFLFNVVLYLLLVQCINNGSLSTKQLYYALDNGAWMFSLCFLIPYIFNIGETTYTGGIGYKGFFYSQNEISLTVIILFYFVLYKLINRLVFRDVVQLGLLFFCGLLLNTKSSIFTCLFGLGFWGIIVLMKQKGRYKLTVIGIGITGVLIFRKILSKSIIALMKRYNFLNNNYGGNTLSTIISGRDYKLNNAISEYTSSHVLFKTLFGNGFWSGTLVEMDIIDSFFYLGLIGAVAVVWCLIHITIKIKKNVKQDKYPIRFMEILIILVFLFFTGHVLFMATSGCYMVLICCFNEFFTKDNFDEINKIDKVSSVSKKHVSKRITA